VDNNLIGTILQNTVVLIDLFSVRGAIRGEELLQVGALRQQIVEILQQASAPATDSTTDETTTPEATN